MKFQLSTALLIFGLITASVGWTVDRQRWHNEREELKASRLIRDEQIYIGSAIFGDTTSAFDVFDKLKNDPAYQEYVQTQCVYKLLEIFEHQEEIEFSGKLFTSAYDARLLSRDALNCMECEETEQFFAIAKSLKKFQKSEYYPELHNIDSGEFRSLKKFISDTIAIKDLILAK